MSFKLRMNNWRLRLMFNVLMLALSNSLKQIPMFIMPDNDLLVHSLSGTVTHTSTKCIIYAYVRDNCMTI